MTDLQIPEIENADNIDLDPKLHLEVPDNGHWQSPETYIGEYVASCGIVELE